MPRSIYLFCNQQQSPGDPRSPSSTHSRFSVETPKPMKITQPRKDRTKPTAIRCFPNRGLPTPLWSSSCAHVFLWRMWLRPAFKGCPMERWVTSALGNPTLLRMTQVLSSFLFLWPSMKIIYRDNSLGEKNRGYQFKEQNLIYLFVCRCRLPYAVLAGLEPTEVSLPFPPKY